MKLLFIFTGGTIGSTASGHTIAPDRQKSYRLLKAYAERYGLPFSYDTCEPYTALSENNDGSTITALLSCVTGALSHGYDGIVITHGTDTLPHSAAALSYAFSDAGIPICLVSSNAPIEDEAANGLANLNGAIRLIGEVGAPGVWVPYRNQGEELKIHRGTRLLGSPPFSDAVQSARDLYYGIFREGEPFCKKPTYRESADGMGAMGAVTLPPVCQSILRVDPFPGMCYPSIGREVRYILHGSYHSGTIATASGAAREFFSEAKDRSIPVFLTGTLPGAVYESTLLFSELSVQPIHGLCPIAAFMKLWMGSLRFPSVPARELLLTPLGGDILPE